MSHQPGPAELLLPPDCHPKIRALLAYWQSKLQGRTMPARRDISPMDVPELLPHLFLVDVPAEGPMVYRLSGTAVVALMGHDVTGRTIGQGMMPGHREEAIHRYRRIANEGRPFFHRARMREATNDFAAVERIVLPLSDDGQRVNMLLGMTIRQIAA